MDTKEFLERMNKGEYVPAGSPLHIYMTKLSFEAMKITSELNGKFHEPDEIKQLFSKLTGRKIDESFGLFPPFTTDCGKNIIVGKGVFINSGCRFQDQGGIRIGDGALIGHNVVIATLNHDAVPDKRASLIPAPVSIGKNVWIGSGSVILPGVSIGDNSVIGAGSVVTKDIPENVIAFGHPAKVQKKI